MLGGAGYFLGSSSPADHSAGVPPRTLLVGGNVVMALLMGLAFSASWDRSELSPCSPWPASPGLSAGWPSRVVDGRVPGRRGHDDDLARLVVQPGSRGGRGDRRAAAGACRLRRAGHRLADLRPRFGAARLVARAPGLPRTADIASIQMRCSDQWSEQRCDPVMGRRPFERATPGTLLLVLLAVLSCLLVLLLGLVLVGLGLGSDCQLPAAGDTTSVEAGVVVDEELPLPVRVGAVECREGDIPIRNRSGSRKVVASRLVPGRNTPLVSTAPSGRSAPASSSRVIVRSLTSVPFPEIGHHQRPAVFVHEHDVDVLGALVLEPFQGQVDVGNLGFLELPEGVDIDRDGVGISRSGRPRRRDVDLAIAGNGPGDRLEPSCPCRPRRAASLQPEGVRSARRASRQGAGEARMMFWIVCPAAEEHQGQSGERYARAWKPPWLFSASTNVASPTASDYRSDSRKPPLVRH